MFFGGVGGVRVRVGNTCGSGSLLRIVGGVAYWLSNAHVTGTAIGRAVAIEAVGLDGRFLTVSGRVAAAGFRRGTSVDWSVIESPALRGFDVIPRLIGAAAGARDLLTVGSPRCEAASMRRLGFVRENSGIGYATPNAIGGQSGSGIFQDLRCVGLITWSNGRNTMYQTGEALARTMAPEFFSTEPVGFELPDDAVQLCEEPQPCEDGFHGALACSQFFAEGFGIFNWVEAAIAAGPAINYFFNALVSSSEPRFGVHSHSDA